MTTGTIIQAFRERCHLTQDAVSNYLGIKREMLSYYETGVREAPLEVLEKLSNLYGAELADFFETEKEQIEANVAFAFRADGISEVDFEQLAGFRKVVKNYLKIIKLEKGDA